MKENTITQDTQNLELMGSGVPDIWYFVLAMMIVIGSSIKGNAQSLSFNNAVPSDLLVCEDAGTFTIEFSNISGAALSNLDLELTLPNGTEYVAGSISESSAYQVEESNISNLSLVYFSVNDLPDQGTVSFTIDTEAGFDAYLAQLSNTVFTNEVKVNFTGGSEVDVTDAYNILYPALSITNVTSLSNTVFVGESFTRTITIVNGGYGSTSTFLLKDTHDSNLQLDAVDIGTLDPNGEDVVFSAADFTGIGNGDGYFDQNEAIVVVQTLTAIGCSSTQDELTAFWGCNSQTSESNTKYAYTTIELFKPSLAVTVQSNYATCGEETADAQQLTIVNNGAGPASAVELEIAPSSATNYSRIDLSSLTYTIDGATTALTPTATQSATTYACLGSNPIDGFNVDLPVIQPGKTLYLNWDQYTCAPDDCGDVNFLGWSYGGDYSDMCDSKNYSFSGTGQDAVSKGMSTFLEFPSDLDDGQTGTYTLTINSATFELPEGTDPYFEMQADIPAGLDWSENAADLVFSSGQVTWSTSLLSYNSSTRVLTARYALPLPTNFSLNLAQFDLKLSADCNAGQGNVTLNEQLFYVMDSSCSSPYRIPMSCQQTSLTQLHCDGACEHGLRFSSFTIARTSFGTSDNDQDGLPDATNSLNMSQVKSNRVMVSDTFETTFSGTVKTSATYPSWSHGYAESEIAVGDEVNILSASISVLDQSSGQTLMCSNVAFTESLVGGVRTVSFDFSPATLSSNGCTDFSDFVFEDEDDIELVAEYKVVGNIGGSAEQVTILNDFYVSNTANGTAFQCDDWNGNFTLVGYYFEVGYSEQYRVRECTETISQTYKMSVGTCCNNFAGGNFFPYEYRNWANIKELSVDIPSGYTLISGYVDQWRTSSTNVSVKETANITPTSITGTLHNFDLEQYTVANGGTLNLSDDGFNGTVYLLVEPACTVNEASNSPVTWDMNFQESVVLGGNVTADYSSTSDRIKYYHGDLTISTNLPTQEGVGRTVSWDIAIKCTRAKAVNAWIYPEDLSNNLTVTEIILLDDNSVVPATNGFYQIGDIKKGRTQDYRITANYGDCDISDVRILTGYNCDAYPTDLDSFPCEYQEFDLYVIPETAELQVRFNSSTSPEDDCDNSFTLEWEILSSKLAAAQDLFVDIIPPVSQSVSVTPGSAAVLYPESGSYASISDPVLSNGAYHITGADMDSIIGADGLVGITDVTANVVKLKCDIVLDNDYEPGELVRFQISGKSPCGEVLDTLALAFDPNASFSKPVSIGLSQLSDAWGMAWADVDGDADVDLFVTNYDMDEANYLYLNDGAGNFNLVSTGVIATDKASSLAATWGDYDNDGDLDLFVANNIGYENFLYRNDGSASFTRILNDPIVTDKGYAHGASWVDYDNDGFLDLFYTEYFPTRFNRLYHNNGDGTFLEENAASPTLEANYSIAGIWGDYNNDGFPDLFVANTEGENNSLYENKGNGNFLKINTGVIVTDGGNSVGGSWGDYDNDGDLDLFVANSGGENNFLYQNNGGNSFTKITDLNIVNDGGHSHGSAWADYDNDGDLDLFVSNNQDQDNFLYANNGDGSFNAIDNEITQDSGESFGAAWADYDNDGGVDLFVTNHDQNENFIYQNSRGKCQNKACITLIGTKSNRSAIGTKIRLKATIYGEEVWQMRELSGQTGGGIGGQNELKTIIGLGDATNVDSIIVEWNSGYRQILTNVTPTQCFDITEENGSEICGLVFYDENRNCVQDTNEFGVPHMELLLQPDNRSVFTDETGAYSTYAPPGTYTLTQVLAGTNWDSICTPEETVVVAGIGNQYCGNNFPDTALCALPDLAVEISATAHRVGFENLIALTYENNGAQSATNVSLTVAFGDYILPLESSVPWTSANGTNRTWDLGTVAVGTAATIYIKDSVAASTPVGQEIELQASISGDETDCDTSDNVFVDRQPAEGAIDPNDILVSPEGYIKATQELSYKIRFQNVGNAAVSTVRVEDQLPEGLNLATFQMGVASHNYRLAIEGNKLVWTFPNINMPDSLTNEPESHGFITYRIQPKKGLERGTELANKALIFFDQVAPLATNTVVNIIGLPTLESADAGFLRIFPNPVTEQTALSIVSEEGTEVNLRAIYAYDLLGKEVMAKQVESTVTYDFERTGLTAGCYLIKLIGEDGKAYSGKMIVR